MLIMLIFIILSVVLIIITAIYTNIKKKNVKHNNTNDSKEKPKNNKKKLGDILNIKIKDGVIYLNNRYSKIIKLGNIDYNILSDKEQRVVESILIETALAVDYPVQFFTTSEFIETTHIIEYMKQNTSENAKVQEYKLYLMEYLKNLMENKSISIIKSYAVISTDNIHSNSIQELNRKANELKTNLLKANISSEILTENEVLNLIYRELHNNSLLDVNTFLKGGKKLYVETKKRRKTTI